MTRSTARRSVIVALAVVATALSSVLSAAQSGAASPGIVVRHACPQPSGQLARCLAEYIVPGTAGADASKAQPLTPADIQSAYKLNPSDGAGMTVGIVDAYDDPKAESDLATYRARYGLPACTTKNGCFRKVNEAGKAKPLPFKDQGWALEISLDLDAVSAACPACDILLVEGDSQSFKDLGQSVDTAVSLGADVVSNSYGAAEFNGMQEFAKYYDHPGTPITVSSGDDAFGPASFPAVTKTAIAVGGTRLVKAPGTARGWSETAWRYGSSGCSAYVPKPSWQHDNHCLMRTVADVSADAALTTGLLIQDSFGYPGEFAAGGTSLSSPLMAAMIAQAGNDGTVKNAKDIYANSDDFFDVVGGRNGSCGGDYLCRAKPGYDAPTGVGSPDGVSGL